MIIIEELKNNKQIVNERLETINKMDSEIEEVKELINKNVQNNLEQKNIY